MRNRAKCRLCKEILESFHRHDYVKCKCDEISIDGGQDYFKAGAKNWENFIRIDDDGNEVSVKVIEEGEPVTEEKTDEGYPMPTRQDKLDMLKNMIDSYERLPAHAMNNPITNYDMAAALLLIYELLKE